MKARILPFAILAVIAAVILSSCESPVKLTSWKNPADNTQISKVVVMPLFEKLEYLKPFEQAMCSYYNRKGLKAMGSLELLNPTIKYPISDIKRKCDSVGADAILVFRYEGTDKTENYVPETTTYVTGGFGGYWGGGYWGGGYYGYPSYGAVTTTGGYWTSTKVVNLKAAMYTHASKEPLWTGDISVTDPEYIDQAAANIAQDIYADWQKSGLLKFQEK